MVGSCWRKVLHVLCLALVLTQTLFAQVMSSPYMGYDDSEARANMLGAGVAAKFTGSVSPGAYSNGTYEIGLIAQKRKQDEAAAKQKAIDDANQKALEDAAKQKAIDNAKQKAIDDANQKALEDANQITNKATVSTSMGSGAPQALSGYIVGPVSQEVTSIMYKAVNKLRGWLFRV